MATDRLDAWLVRKGLFEDIEEARRVILAGRVRDLKSGEVLDKPGQRPRKDLEVVVDEQEKFVSRGGYKLEGFINEAGLSIQGQTVLDVGASTGGFSDCCLQKGARRVYCVDVGTHQLHEKLRKDPRVQFWEQVDIRKFDWSLLRQKPDLVVVDLSFISLRLVVRDLVEHGAGARFIFLFKPQFEVDRDVPKARGVAPQLEAGRALEEMLQFLKDCGLNVLMVRASTLKGTKGNQETFIMAERQIPEHIFRTYDIRGHAERELSNELFLALGYCFGNRLEAQLGKPGRVGVGRDARLSSPRFFDHFTRGLKASGQTVINLGEVPTPMTYFAHYNLACDAVAQITASHNPKDDNGIKMMILKNTLFGDEIRSFYQEVLGVSGRVTEVESGCHEDRSEELRQKYLSFLAQSFHFSKRKKVVLDCGNGMVGAVAREVFGPVSSDLHILYEAVDCRFPNHEADPTIPANLIDLQKEVERRGADIGFAFDGDGDRLGVITQSGRILWGDEIIMLLSELVLKQKPGATIIGEVKCSQKLFTMIAGRGGRPIMYKTGHSLIKKHMKEVGAPIAGEMSGHLFFADRFFGFDDACYAALRVLEVLDTLGLDLDQWIEKFPPTHVTPEIRVHCEESEKVALVEKAKDVLSKIPQVEVVTIDGIRANFADGSWALVRASNTQAVVVVRVEAPSLSRLNEVLEIIERAFGRKLKGASHV